MTRPHTAYGDNVAEMRSHLRSFLRREWTESGLDAKSDDYRNAAIDRVAARLADDFGVTSLVVDVAEGGAACTTAAAVCAELGGAFYPNRWLADMMAGALAPEIARAQLAWPGDDPTWDLGRIDACRFERGCVTGRIRLTLADRDGALIVPVSSVDVRHFVAVPAAAAGRTRTTAWSADVVRPLSDIDLDGVSGTKVDVDHPQARAVHALAFGAICLAAEMVGTARACLDMASGYARIRVQFGQPIGKFQVVRHRLADLLANVESARAVTFRAASFLDRGTPTGEVLARIAKTRAAACLHEASEVAIQVHGGMGFTWEVPLHFAAQQWGTSAHLFGSEVDHYQRIFAQFRDHGIATAAVPAAGS